MKTKNQPRGNPKPITGESYRFHAPSDVYGQYPYLVDLWEHSGEGHCECNSFKCSVLPGRRNGEENQLKRLCKHQKRVLVYWAHRELRTKIDGSDPLFASVSNTALILWALKEIRKRVREERKLNKLVKLKPVTS